MKIKKLYIFSILILLFLSLCVMVLIIYYPYFNLQYGFNEAKQLAEYKIDREFDSDNEFSNYFSDNQDYIDVLHYDLKITLFPETQSINAHAGIRGVITNDSISSIDLNFYDNFKIDSALLNGEKTDYYYNNKLFSIKEFPSNMDTFFVEIKYEGSPEKMGLGSFNFDQMENGSFVIYNLSQPVYASTWFPCNDMPDDKAVFDISITNDKHYTSVSNGRLIGIENRGDKKTFHWKTEYPTSTYLAAVLSAEYTNFQDSAISNSGDTIKLDYYVFKDDLENAKNDFKINSSALNFFSDTFGAYPFGKEKYGIAEITWKLGAMENQTIVGLGKNFIGGRQFFSDLLIHEAAHSWWGNAVGPKTWKDIWLNEGFATYSEALYWEYKSGHDALISTLLPKKRFYDQSPVYNPAGDLFSNLVYNKGAWILHMLRFETGDENFFNILRAYFEKFKYKNASTDDFISICNEISRTNLEFFFDQWVYNGTGILELQYSFETFEESGSYETEINLSQIQDGFGAYRFPLEIDFKFESGEIIRKKNYISSRDTVLQFRFENKLKNINLDPDSWLLARIKPVK